MSEDELKEIGLAVPLMDDSAPLPVTVVIPAYNEGLGVAEQVVAIRRVLSSHCIPHEIVVVDDGSQDGTAESALRAGARVLQHSRNRGYGASIKSGILASRCETIAICDADGTYPAEALPSLLAKLQRADMAVGARTGKSVHVPLARRPAKWLLGKLANHVAGQRIPDLNSGLRAFRRDTVRRYFPILSNRFSFTTTVTLALMADDYSVVYHPIDYYQRVGSSKITPRHFMDFVVLVLRMAMLFQPLKVFVPLAFTCGLVGILKVIFDIATHGLRAGGFDWSMLYQPVLSTSAVLLLTVALQFLLIGMLADGVVRRIAIHNEPMAASHAVRTMEYSSQVTEGVAEKVLRSMNR